MEVTGVATMIGVRQAGETIRIGMDPGLLVLPDILDHMDPVDHMGPVDLAPRNLEDQTHFVKACWVMLQELLMGLACFLQECVLACTDPPMGVVDHSDLLDLPLLARRLYCPPRT
jgi:hypothetical protein